MKTTLDYIKYMSTSVNIGGSNMKQKSRAVTCHTWIHEF